MRVSTQSNLILLARVEAWLGGILAVGVFVVTGADPASVTNSSAALGAAVFGVTAVTYYLTINQIISRWSLSVSTLILTGITMANFAFIITATGGLNSPYYALWLLAIVAAGLFGRRYTIATLAVTLAYFAYYLLSQAEIGLYLRDHIIELILTLIAGIISEWIHSRVRVEAAETSRLSDARDRLGIEQLKVRSLIADLADAVVLVDAAGHIQLVNQAAQDLTGWEGTSPIGLNYGSILKLESDDGQAKSADPFAEAWSTRKPLRREDLNLISRSGRKINVRLSISPIFDDQTHEPIGAVAMMRDISREKALERQKDEFVSTASHEMRTPIAAIEGYLSLALNPKAAQVDDRARKYLESAHNSIGHLGQLFRDLLSVTRAEQGMEHEPLHPVNVYETLISCVNDMQFTAQAKGLKLSLQTGSSGGRAVAPLFYVAANPERLREVILNLIDNAIKYTPQGNVTVILGGDDKEARVTVADSGIGIASGDIPHLFQKFYRVDSTATRTIGGTGLGLFLCRRVIEMYSGRIWVESKPGQGSRFNFALPRLSQIEIERLSEQAAATISPSSIAQT